MSRRIAVFASGGGSKEFDISEYRVSAIALSKLPLLICRLGHSRGDRSKKAVAKQNSEEGRDALAAPQP